MPRVHRIAVVLAVAVAALTACAGGPGTAADADGRVRVVAGLYPLAYLAEQIGGDDVEVTTLAAAGVEPHDLELSPTQVAQIAQADVVLYVPGLQPALDEAVAQQAPDAALDVTASVTTRPASTGGGGTDPHVWLDPANMAAMGRALAERLGTAVPDAAARSARFAERMDELAADMRSGLADCRIRDVVVTHESFGYLADAYGLHQIGLSGIDPQAEPSPARLAEVADLVRANAITTIYTEPLIPAEVAETIAAETGTVTAVLDPIEARSSDPDADYEKTMRANLAALRLGQDCR